MSNDFQPSGPLPGPLMGQPEAIHAALEGVITIDENLRIIMINPAAQRMFLRTADEVMGMPLAELLPARLRAAHEKHVRQFMASDLTERLLSNAPTMVGLRANGEEFPLNAVICKVDLTGENGVRHCCTALLYDRSEEQKLSATIDRLNQQMRSIFDRAPVAIWITDGDRIVFANRACCKLFEVDDPDELVGKPIHELLSIESHTSLWDKVGEALANEDRVSTVNGEVVQNDGGVREVELVVGALPDHQRTLVQMVITDITQRSQERRDLLRSRRTLRELSASIVDAREEERRRIARELHDELGQRLMALKLELSAQLQGGTTELQPERVQAMIDMVDETVASARRIAMGLRPPMLDDLGLEAAIEWLVGNFRQHNAIEVDLALKPVQAAIAPEVSIAVYRILQEALTNIARHAGAHQVRIAFGQNGRWLQLSVEDNGIGFPQNEPPTPRGSFGLIGVRERVLMLGGQLTIKNVAGGGARLEIRIPLPQAGAATSRSRSGSSQDPPPPEADPSDQAFTELL